MPLKSALLRDFGGCCFAVTLLKVAFMVIRGDHRKFNGESDFTLSELRKLKKMLNLTNEDVDRIFLANHLRKRKNYQTIRKEHDRR